MDSEMSVEAFAQAEKILGELTDDRYAQILAASHSEFSHEGLLDVLVQDYPQCHDACGTCELCGFRKLKGALLIMIDAYTQLRDSERERAESEVVRLHCAQRPGMIAGHGCWGWVGKPNENPEARRVLHSDACPICIRVLGKGLP